MKRLKRERVIILTSHLMEEAEALSDRIMILSHGKVKCIGNSLLLKEKIGSYWRIDLTFKDSSIQEDILLDLRRIARDERIDVEGKFTQFYVNSEGLKIIFKMVAEHGQLEGKIKDWGFKQTSLDEVFFNFVK